MVYLELLNKENEKNILAIERDDIPECFVEDMDDTIQMSHYGDEHGLNGCCYAIKSDENYVGLILLGEAIPDNSDPDELKKQTYFRILGFVIDRRYKGNGIGSQALSLAMKDIISKYGNAPFLLQCHRDNQQAIQFYEKMGFKNTNQLNDDYYYMIKR